MPRIQNQLIVSGINDIILSSALPNDIVKNTKTIKPAENSTKLKLSLRLSVRVCDTMRSSKADMLGSMLAKHSETVLAISGFTRKIVITAAPDESLLM